MRGPTHADNNLKPEFCCGMWNVVMVWSRFGLVPWSSSLWQPVAMNMSVDGIPSDDGGDDGFEQMREETWNVHAQGGSMIDSLV
jgi:hypothetical protein